MIERDSGNVLTDACYLYVSPAGMIFRPVNYKLEGESDSDGDTEWAEALCLLPINFEMNTYEI